MKEVENLILGATFYGCGLASVLPGALLCESSAVPGGDFTLSFNPGANYRSGWSTPVAADFYAELVDRRALAGDRAALAAFTPILAGLLIRRRIGIHLVSTFVRNDSGTVELLHADGLHRYRVRRIIDARPRPAAVKYLTALIQAPEDPGDGVFGDAVWRRGIYPGEYCYSLPFPAATGYPEGRRALLTAWAARPPELRSATLGLIAVHFDCRNDENPAAALERGALTGKEMI